MCKLYKVMQREVCGSCINNFITFTSFCIGKKYTEQLQLSDIEMVQMIMNKNPMLQGREDNGSMYPGHSMISMHINLIFNDPKAFIGCKEC